MEREITTSNFIIGHEEQRQRLERLWRLQKLPSALLFTGNSGIGKSLVAKELFQSLFCERGDVYGGCHECHACHLFETNNYPDFYEKDFLDKEETTVEKLRELLYSLHLSSFAGKHRAILFHNIELINVQGANLLLKILEEPRPDIHFCLLSSNPSRLPATIISRCHNWFFDKLNTSQIQEIIQKKGWQINCSEEDLSILTDGTLENISDFEVDAPIWQELKNNIEKIIAGDTFLAANFASEMNKNRELLRTKLKMLAVYARSKMLSENDPLKRLKWSLALTNFLEAEPLIFERNVRADFILSLVLTDLAKQKPEIGTRNKLLHEMVF